MPDAPDASAFWTNLRSGRYSISDVPPERWDPELYYDPDPQVPDKTYSRIGGWVREFPWDPRAWQLPIPPKVADQMDDGQRWAVSAARAAMTDAGWPDWDVDPEQVAVIFGNAIGGEKQYATNLRIQLPEVLRELEAAPTFGTLSDHVRRTILEETRKGFLAELRRDQRGHDARRAGERARPAGSRTCSTSADRTSPRTRRAPPASRPSGRRLSAWRPGSTTSPSPVASTATWASRRS